MIQSKTSSLLFPVKARRNGDTWKRKENEHQLPGEECTEAGQWKRISDSKEFVQLIKYHFERSTGKKPKINQALKMHSN